MSLKGAAMRHWSPWLIGCGILSCGTLLFLTCSVGVLGVMYWRGQKVTRAQARVDRIAYSGNDGNIYLIDRDGQNKLAITSDAEVAPTGARRLYRVPTWPPDSQHLAFVGLSLEASGDVRAVLHDAPASGGTSSEIYSTTGGAPFYLYWSPDSQRVAFLAQSDTGQDLDLKVAARGEPVETLDTGSPFYFSWSPDSRSLLFHVGGTRQTSPDARLALLHLNTDSRPRVLDGDPASFLAPAWAPDGRSALLAARDATNNDSLVLVDQQGGAARTLLQYQGAIAFVWSPRGDGIGYLITTHPAVSGLDQISLGPITVMDRDGGNQRQVTEELALAFFWSPDGEQIAYLTPVLGGDGQQGALRAVGRLAQQSEGPRMRWQVFDFKTGERHSIATFVPTSEFLSLIPFFDQYAQSMTLWSPDSRSLVYAAIAPDAGSGIYVADVTGAEPPRRIADGDLATWSWR
jgi:TolB protein